VTGEIFNFFSRNSSKPSPMNGATRCGNFSHRCAERYCAAKYILTTKITKYTKVADNLNSELRALRAFVVNTVFDSLPPLHGLLRSGFGAISQKLPV
jgi:hypothetical protein